MNDGTYTVALIDGELSDEFAPCLSFHDVSMEDFELLRRLAEHECYLVVSRRCSNPPTSTVTKERQHNGL